ncbi:MAG: MarR family winged helix-turn-helix transcriptional regulator [Acidimicrobiales bacterium]|nr:MarR family winged helix-turn-helix transcriptional regulator [Acidimicrobiales bacterium]
MATTAPLIHGQGEDDPSSSTGSAGGTVVVGASVVVGATGSLTGVSASSAIVRMASARSPSIHSELDQTTADLLLRLQLENDNRMRAVELCEQLMKSPSHISRMIDRAEVAGPVLREPDPDNRRAQQVVLQPAGEKAVDAFLPALDAVIQRSILDQLSEAEVDTLVELLGRIEQGARTCALRNETDHG